MYGIDLELLIYYVLATITKFNMEMCDKDIG